MRDLVRLKEPDKIVCKGCVDRKKSLLEDSVCYPPPVEPRCHIIPQRLVGLNNNSRQQPRRDSNPQSSAPKSDALSVRPRGLTPEGLSLQLTEYPKSTHHYSLSMESSQQLIRGKLVFTSSTWVLVALSNRCPHLASLPLI